MASTNRAGSPGKRSDHLQSQIDSTRSPGPAGLPGLSPHLQAQIDATKVDPNRPTTPMDPSTATVAPEYSSNGRSQ
jgi:hypothetical protein